MEKAVRQTPLFAVHGASGARIVDFAGWAMPVLYTGILEETRAARTGAGLFDISHMGRVHLSGAGATAFLQSITSNDVDRLHPSQAQYSLLTNPQGGIQDDIIVYRQGPETYLVVINASNTEKDLAWMRRHLPASVTLQDDTEPTAMIAIQGPQAPRMVAAAAGNPAILELSRFQFASGELSGAPATLCRTGYTGEDGFEVIVPAEQAGAIWDSFVSQGARPCGLGARDALRIEAGYPLYGHEIDETTSPVEAGLMWAVRLSKGTFFGSEAILAARQAGPRRMLMGLVSRERIVPRQGYTIYANQSGDEVIGQITSGVFSPSRGHSVGMGYVAIAHARAGETVQVAVRDKRIDAVLVPRKTLLNA